MVMCGLVQLIVMLDGKAIIDSKFPGQPKEVSDVRFVCDDAVLLSDAGLWSSSLE